MYKQNSITQQSSCWVNNDIIVVVYTITGPSMFKYLPKKQAKIPSNLYLL